MPTSAALGFAFKDQASGAAGRKPIARTDAKVWDHSALESRIERHSMIVCSFRPACRRLGCGKVRMREQAHEHVWPQARASHRQKASNCREPGNLSLVRARMHFDARPRAPNPWMRVRMNVIAAIHPNTTPRRAIEIDGVRAPQKIRMHPSKREESRGDDQRPR